MVNKVGYFFCCGGWCYLRVFISRQYHLRLHGYLIHYLTFMSPVILAPHHALIVSPCPPSLSFFLFFCQYFIFKTKRQDTSSNPHKIKMVVQFYLIKRNLSTIFIFIIKFIMYWIDYNYLWNSTKHTNQLT